MNFTENFFRLAGTIAFAILTLSIVSCSEDNELPKTVMPWDWEPEEPELVSGKAVYSKTCYLCHNEGEESAPMLTDRSEWEERIAKGEALLIQNAIKGFFGDDGHMPPRGDNKSLTDEEVTAAVRFMIAAPKNH
ncbi:MAG: c-type cytochrome [Verrucomicrobiota bacterium]